ncbi:hypothetical protein BC834DRAFT_965707 [Gloeopeniophorella convolvens]|nr:hypothetical protein BC834DRAFT_965707 [Gloeopeniophorella convolvens]
MSTTRRRNTVHDFSALRLHPDGARVTITSPKKVGLYDRATYHTGRDARGNRFARDAAGLGAVPRRSRRPAPEEDGEAFNLSDGDVESVSTRRSRKRRRRIDGDVEFLQSSRAATHESGSGGGWSVPSSDLLKSIHYFASEYYTAHGMLSDRSRIYRREKKELRSKAAFAADEEDDDLFAEGEQDSEDGESGEDEVHSKQDDKDKGDSPDIMPDMYKAFDGSALMAIGMLLQEHVSAMFNPKVPPGWEEEMEANGHVVEDEDINLDEEEDYAAVDELEGQETLPEAGDDWAGRRSQ